MEQEFCMIITTIDSEDLAKKLAESLVYNRLAACVQIDKINSVYSWNGEMCNSEEYRLMIKTTAELYEKAEDFIVKNHSYETPEIIRLKIEEGLSSYLKWIKSCTCSDI